MRSWVVQGIVSGCVGATAIAVFFLAVDVARGEPFRTPGALGSALFLGELLPAGVPPTPAVVFAYTVLHGAIFLSLGLMAAYALVRRGRVPGPRTGLGVGVALFAGFEACSLLLFAGMLSSELLDSAGEGEGALAVTAANALAAGLMAAVLVRRPSGRRR